MHKESKQMSCWIPPPFGYLKLNVDGTMFFYQRKASVDVVLRNEKGEVILACSKVKK